MIPELLAPAGGPEPFAAALSAGADAIYVGMGTFNARRKAHNFSNESFEQACRTAHLAGARVYVTVNIVIKDSEMVDALELVRTCAELGADAFIIQDWGLFFEIRRLMPELELHVSTQANIHDVPGTAWCKAAGAARVTLSRELSLAEIKEIAQVGIDLEVFAHGSICFSYSGVCLLSSFVCVGRSANRGMCAQPCRLPYDLVDENGLIRSAPGRGRPLCPRDTNTSEMLAAFVDAGVASLKLEGRMKAPDYVYAITDVYRQYLNDLKENKIPSQNVINERARQLKRSFNRDFTHAYQCGTSGDEMMSYERSNNRGQEVGLVCGFKASTRTRRDGKVVPQVRRDGRGPNGLCFIKLSEPVGAGDLLEIRHDQEFDQFLTAHVEEDASAGETITVKVPRPMPNGARVRVIRNQHIFDAAHTAIKQKVLRRRAVDVHVIARLGKPFSISLVCVDNPQLAVTVNGFVVEAARTRAVTYEDIAEHVGRMGSSPFVMHSCVVDLDDGCGMSFSNVHKVRTAACSALIEHILNAYAQRTQLLRSLPSFSDIACTSEHPVDLNTSIPHEIRFSSYEKNSVCVSSESTIHTSTTITDHALITPEICALVTNLDDVRIARSAGAMRIYMTVDSLLDQDISPTLAHDENIIPVLDEVSRTIDHPRLKPWICAHMPVAVGTISELYIAAQTGSEIELRSCIPVHNLACARSLAVAGARCCWLSPELTLDEIGQFAPLTPNMTFGIIVMGKPRVMTSEHCILQVAHRCIHDCANCAIRKESLYLRNIDGKLLPVRTNLEGRSHLYDAYSIDITPQIPQLLKAGVSRFMVDGTLLSSNELADQVSHAAHALDASIHGRRPAKRLSGMNAGCLFVGVG